MLTGKIRFIPSALLSVCFAASSIHPAMADQPAQNVIIDSDGKPQPKTIEIPSDEIQIAAHRGGYETDKADNAPENSVANIRVCQEKGYAFYETDIRRTRDGHFVIMHDPTIDRETTGSGVASELNLDELKALRKTFRDGSKSQHRVATLDEFLVEGKGRVRFKADLKPGVNRYFKEIMELVTRRQAVDGIVFRVPYGDADLFHAYQNDGLTLPPDLLMFKVSHKKQVDDIRKRFNPSMIQVNVPKQDPADPQTLELIRYATAKGFVVEAHAEGTEQNWQQLIEAGVRIFHTTKPAKMKSFLQKMIEANG